MRHLMAVLTFIALAAPAGAQTLKAVSFTGIVQVKMPNGDIYGFVPGGATPEIPFGSEVSVVSGQAVFTTPAGVTAAAGTGDSFAYSASGAQAAFESTAGSGLLVSYGTSEAAIAKGGKVAIAADPANPTLSVLAGSAKVTTAGKASTLAAGQSVKLPAPALAAAAPMPAAPAPRTASMDSPAPKRGGLRLGAAEFHPYYSLTESYDSNIYLVPKDLPSGARQGGGVRSAWITKNNVGFTAKVPVSPIHSFDMGYDFALSNYSKQSRINDSLNHKADLGYGYSGPAGLSARLWDTYINTTDPAFSELAGDRNIHWSNMVAAKLDYAPEGGRLVAGIFADHTAHKYVDGVTMGPLLNRYEQTAGATLGYRVMPKTKVYTTYRRQVTHYTANSVSGDDKNSKSHLLDLGVESALSSKLKGDVAVGWQLKDYDQAFNSSNGVAGAQRKSYARSWTGRAGVTWLPRPDCKWNLTAFRALQDSTFSNNRYYTTNNLALNVDHKFPYKLTGRAKLAMAIDKYSENASASTGVPGIVRRDDTYTEGVGVGYQLRNWVGFGLDYEHAQRFSNFPGSYNYERHLTMASVKLAF